ncbi:rRNA methyltransferase [Hyphomonas sp. WL0036]|uniref:transcription antitermination factor NusB n=1 Tax=Hyphomonas sediminis TaxID=2866160 RepID=UPI001C827FBF|nr:transcription antitermination factor NusB [Hyphomonas sediminis]MBY9066104.1 rRNA methyltransferase [Hyphomonas sediminis]
MSGAAARLAAGRLLHLVLDKRRTLDEAMVADDAFSALEGSDRAFARAIASSALRHLGWIDQAVAPLLSRPLAATGAEIRALIRAGAAQLWFMDVPPHAAVSETVEAARMWAPARSGGSFLNAALRRVSERPSPAETLSPLALWPEWLAAALEQAYGTQTAEALALAQLEEPRLHLSAKADPAAVAAATGGTLMADGTVELDSGVVEILPGYSAGDWWVQDAAARLPARLLAPQAGERILDLCAAPGGKTLQLAAAGATVTALDRSRPRLERLKENLVRTGLHADVIVADGEAWAPPALFPKILLDAPCSALGTLKRHPEGAWIKTQGDAARFSGVQARLLDAATAMLSPGGTLVYCVCTPVPAEGVEIVEAAIAKGLLARAPVTADEIPGFEAALTPAGDVLTLPRPGHHHDAFYMARLTRPAA